MHSKKSAVFVHTFFKAFDRHSRSPWRSAHVGGWSGKLLRGLGADLEAKDEDGTDEEAEEALKATLEIPNGESIALTLKASGHAVSPNPSLYPRGRARRPRPATRPRPAALCRHRAQLHPIEFPQLLHLCVFDFICFDRHGYLLLQFLSLFTEVSLRIIFVTFVRSGSKSFWIPVTGVWCWIERAVGEDHWEIDKEGVLFVLLDKVTNEIGAHLWPVFPGCEILFFSVEFKHRVDEASVDSFSVFIGTSTSCMLPEAGFFEAEMLGRIRLVSQLPLTGDAGGIASGFELMGKGRLSTVKHAKLHIVSYIVLPGHDLGP